MKRAIKKKKRKHHDISDSDDSDSSWDDGLGSTKKLCNKIDCNEIMNTYLSSLKTSPRANITFSDSNNTSLNPEEDLENLPAEPTKSVVTAKLPYPKLLSDLFNSVNPLPQLKKDRSIL